VDMSIKFRFTGEIHVISAARARSTATTDSRCDVVRHGATISVRHLP